MEQIKKLLQIGIVLFSVITLFLGVLLGMDYFFTLDKFVYSVSATIGFIGLYNFYVLIGVFK